MLPRGSDRRKTLFLAFALLFVISTKPTPAQVFDLERDRVQMAELHGLWRFHTGDDTDGKLGWASPALDDSTWKLLPSDHPWTEEGYKGYSGMAWYRFQVVLPAQHKSLALYIPGIAGSYQVFARDRLIGQFGGLPPHERVFFFDGPGQILPIPPDLAHDSGPLTIAIRVWSSPRYFTFSGGGPREAVRIGDASLLTEWESLQFRHWFWSSSAQCYLLFGYLLAGFAGLGLYLLRPSEHEYLWFSASELMFASVYALSVYLGFHPAWDQAFITLLSLTLLAWGVSFSSFLVALLKTRSGWIYRIAIISPLIACLFQVLGTQASLSFARLALLRLLAWLPFQVCVLLLLFFPAKRGNLDARLLLGPVGLGAGNAFVEDVLGVFENAGYSWAAAYEHRFDHLFTWPFPISVGNLVDFLVQISILAILILRFARTRRDEERQAAELEAARTVQQVLIPEEVPAIPGLALECVYKPAGQVGGDFFQILPTPNNGALIVIGDVSGKGMPAAMAVSLLVGTVRTLAHYTQSPAEILTAMNQRMLGRSKDGFTTCLVLRFDPDGAATVANAGHLAPYAGCTEVPVESGLPLGLATQAEYTESSFHLDTGEQLTLLTDGVAEARAKTGELFGFERTASIATLSATQIAATAAAFGQQDDITVLKIRRSPVQEPALASHDALQSKPASLQTNPVPSAITTFL